MNSSIFVLMSVGVFAAAMLASTEVVGSPNVFAQVLPNGATWIVNGNGHITSGTFTYGPDGRVSGTMYGDRIIGFWDSNSQKIIFMRMDEPSNPSSYQIYTGFPFVEKRPNPNPNGSPLCYHFLAGSFLTPAGAGGYATRNEYGWIAQGPQRICD